MKEVLGPLQAFKEGAQHPDPEEAARAVACRRVYENTIRRQLRLEVARANAAAEARRYACLTAIGLKAHSETGVRARGYTRPAPVVGDPPSAEISEGWARVDT